jgi:hypothetical protein
MMTGGSKGRHEVGLYDGKESGSLENSCGVLLGIWKTSQIEMNCKVLKNTKGQRFLRCHRSRRNY